ncbi:MAG: hypothetical protein HY832_02610 [Candidatus Aenigmarchaeota archaeon]|nr:hypothetical protein [Candidatus Aenigmarchaeota archaeon]
MNKIDEIRTVLLNKKYAVAFFFLIIIFSVVYIFEWNLILFPDIYVRTDLWTLENLAFLTVISILSGLSVTLSIFTLKNKLPCKENKNHNAKQGFGFFAFIPAIFTSACPGCAPLILSFTSTTFAIGLSLAQFGTIIKIITILLLLVSVYFLSSSIGKCKITG